uniref:Protein tyrosine phosphatase n=1 Tax=Panagrolaimus superbus TaxID=310955 RepID=A0A914YQW0_9BILA
MEEALVLGLRKIRKEFVEHVKGYIPSGSIKACTEYNAYNRYEDVNCLDKTRVIIKSTYMTTGEDYIHASYVNVNPDLVYICAQGPLDTTCGHFWLMIMQEKSKVILQLCSFMEDGKEKCNEYYPAKGTEWETYGCVQVRVTDRNSNIPGMKKVVKSKMQVRIEDTTDVHEVTHIFFHGWPDHGVPESIGTVREIRNLIHRTYEKKPIVAHCSAGIGRTGTFVMMELVLYHLLDKHDAKFKMYEVAKELRNQRMHALQNDLQYVLVYRCVIDVLINENAILQSAEITKFNDEFADLIKRKRGADKKPKNRATT